LKHPLVRKSEIGRILHLKSENRDTGLDRLATYGEQLRDTFSPDAEVNGFLRCFARVCPMWYFGFRIWGAGFVRFPISEPEDPL